MPSRISFSNPLNVQCGVRLAVGEICAEAERRRASDSVLKVAWLCG